ncbi:MAG: Secretion system C-terminal sorting domain, partial [Bacteroidota bacterium]
PSGHLLASDMQLGLFVLDVSQITGTGEPAEKPYPLSAYPNPSKDYLKVRLPETHTEGRAILMDVTGRILHQEVIPAGQHHVTMNTALFPAGLYRLTLEYNGSREGTNFLISH